MKVSFLLLLYVLLLFTASAQKLYITASIPAIKNTQVQLIGYNGFNGVKDTLLSQVQSDSTGKFVLTYPASFTGAALLLVKDVTSLIVLLNNENFNIQWNDLKDIKTLRFSNSAENDAFAQGIAVYEAAEAKLAGLKYLINLYHRDKNQFAWLNKEINIQQSLFPLFLQGLPSKMYARFYLTVRKLITDMPVTANRYIERLPEHERSFNMLDFNDQRLLHSGIYKDLIDGYYQLLESYGNLDSVYAHANISIDRWIKCLQNNPDLQQEMAEHVFKLLEQRSLFGASKYLATAMLNKSSCQLNEKLTDLFEQYRKMAIGNTAPDINLDEGKKLSDIKNRYKLVAFGASWCPNCKADFPRLVEKFNSLKKNYDLELVYISLDTSRQEYLRFFKDAPFITHFDGKAWHSQAVTDYHVFATPTMMLLDDKNKILMKLKSAEHLEAWLKTNGVVKQ